MLLVSFCDIVTITTAAMFMAMIIVIDESMRIPVIRATPVTKVTTNAPAYFECRGNRVYPIRRDQLSTAFHQASTTIAAAARSGQKSEAVLQQIMAQQLGDDAYTLDPRYMLMGVMALRPRPEIKGATLQELNSTTNNAFRVALRGINTNTQYCVFLVRDDSFAVFRKARDMCLQRGYLSGWEYVGRHESLTFDGQMGQVGIQ